jgi:hypothetical protein
MRSWPWGNLPIIGDHSHRKSTTTPRLRRVSAVEGRVGLLGEVPVRLRAEGKVLAAYGFGGQRIEIPARSAGGPVTRVAAGLGQAVLCVGGGIGGSRFAAGVIAIRRVLAARHRVRDDFTRNLA